MLAGESSAKAGHVGHQAVSIHARHCWRANPHCAANCAAPSWFQSTPAIAGGRILEVKRRKRTSAQFQSTPAIAGGRIRLGEANPQSDPCFNPRPPLLAGESFCTSAWGSGAKRFNPRPPLLAGESCQHVNDVLTANVSIHARHCWRANRHSQGGGACTQVVSIHARHCWRANRLASAYGVGLRLVSIHARHCWRANPDKHSSVSVSRSFNPRPPLLAGESRSKPLHSTPRKVSIHARHCWRANRPGRGRRYQLQVVSIHARHCWRANRLGTWPANGRFRFQSTPAIAGGRILPAYDMEGNPLMFQSTPAIAGGRIPSHVTPCQAMVFSCACANLAMPSCVCMKNHRQTIKNRIKTKCCEVREPPGEKLFTGGSRRSPYHGTGRAPPVTAPAGHQNPSP